MRSWASPCWGFADAGRVDPSGLELKLAAPVFTMPAFSFKALFQPGHPHVPDHPDGQYGDALVRTMAMWSTPNPGHGGRGFGSLLTAPFGSHAFNVSAITAAICTGSEAHEDPSKRWIAGVAAGQVFYILTRSRDPGGGLHGPAPPSFINTLAGLACWAPSAAARRAPLSSRSPARRP